MRVYSTLVKGSKRVLPVIHVIQGSNKERLMVAIYQLEVKVKLQNKKC